MGALSDGAEPAPVTPRGRWRRWLLAASVLAALLGLPSLLSWQQRGLNRAAGLSNIRRVAYGALLYSQDWDGRFMPIARRRETGDWQTWPQTLSPYVGTPATFSNPANPVQESLKHPSEGYPVLTSFAFNRRFWDTFAPGPFPLENLELPAQTALFVGAGPMWRDPLEAPRRRADGTDTALLEYGDTLDRRDGFSPYPSPHDGQTVVAAADGHGILVKVQHYTASQGEHDRLFGRIGGDIYNWNGGHPNGETDRPSRE